MEFLSTQTIPHDLVPFAHQFPIFRNYAGTFAPVALYIPPPTDQVHVDLLHGLAEFLDIPAESVVFARTLGAKEISVLEFYKNFVFPRIPKLSTSIRDSAMLKLLRKLREITDANFKSLLTTLAFVPTASG